MVDISHRGELLIVINSSFLSMYFSKGIFIANHKSHWSKSSAEKKLARINLIAAFSIYLSRSPKSIANLFLSTYSLISLTLFLRCLWSQLIFLFHNNTARAHKFIALTPWPTNDGNIFCAFSSIGFFFIVVHLEKLFETLFLSIVTGKNAIVSSNFGIVKQSWDLSRSSQVDIGR